MYGVDWSGCLVQRIPYEMRTRVGYCADCNCLHYLFHNVYTTFLACPSVLRMIAGAKLLRPPIAAPGIRLLLVLLLLILVLLLSRSGRFIFTSGPFFENRISPHNDNLVDCSRANCQRQYTTVDKK